MDFNYKPQIKFPQIISILFFFHTIIFLNEASNP